MSRLHQHRGAMLRLWRGRDGATAVEFALVAPLLMLVLLGVMETGRVMWTQAALNFAVQEASRCMAVDPTCATNAGAQAFAAQKVAGLKIPASAFAITQQTCGRRIRAEVTYSFVLKAIFSTAPKISAQVCRAA